MKGKTWKIAVLSLSIVCFLAMGLAFAQAKKVGGGDIKYTPKGADPVLFSHEAHGPKIKSKCTDCHTKIFPMKKSGLKMSKEAHGQDKLCAACHDGKKAFSMATDADCAKCHKK